MAIPSISAVHDDDLATLESPFVLVLGISQDGGFPQAGCGKPCCETARAKPVLRRFVASLAIVDPVNHQRWLIDCTPDFPKQLALLDRLAPVQGKPALDGILLTHAHIGHYAGLIHLGREVMGTRQIPVHVMPRMDRFLRANGPWSQLVKLNNIEPRPLRSGTEVKLNNRVGVTPLVVPHRDEFSETVGFIIRGPERSVLWLPDIDKWDRWKQPIEQVLTKVDRAYLDGTFYSDGELPGRDMSAIPHPFIAESVERFSGLPLEERQKVHFIHLNHTNPGLDEHSEARATILRSGHNVGRQGEKFPI